MARQLQKLDLVAPGRLGLNREERSRLLNPGFATVAKNFRLNSSGLMSARKGISTKTTTDIATNPAVETLFEYYKEDGTVEVISAWDGGIGSGVADPEGNDISGALTDTNGTWRMQNFNDKCLAFQAGHKLAIYTGTTFATVSESGGTAPSSGIATVAYGRVWQVDDTDEANLKYCGLLDEADWNGTGAGAIDFSNIWTEGQDSITAVAGFNGALVVFGMNHIVFLTDGTGNELGLNPNNMYVSDVIHGTGCVDQRTIQAIGETDLVFLSRNGVQTLSRLLNERSNPTTAVSKNIRTEITEAYRASTAGTLRSVYSPDEGLYILTFPGDKSYAFDTRFLYQDESGDTVAPIFQWTLLPTAWAYQRDGTLLAGGAGEIFEYTGTTDDGSSIQLDYESGWLDFGEEVGNQLKILKKLGAIIFTSSNDDITMKWATDFETVFGSIVKTFTATTTGAEWGTALWGTSEWGPGGGQKLFKVPARGTGQYFKVGFSALTAATMSVQQIELIAKIGRTA
jgi:hypothetical protein